MTSSNTRRSPHSATSTSNGSNSNGSNSDGTELDGPSKKDIRQAAHALRHSGKFDPSRRVAASPEEQLRELAQAERSERTFASANTCAACARERRESNDAQALCRDHLAEAMGF